MQGTFSSSLGVLISMLGSVVGTGNIWRFPRIVANNASDGGKKLIVMEVEVLASWCFYRAASASMHDTQT